MAFDRLIKGLRKVRVWHRYLGLVLALLLIISAGTGILLALKKDVAMIQPSTQRGAVTDLTQWKKLSELSLLGKEALYKSYPEQIGNAVDKIDVRPSKGMVKVLFKNDNWEVQLDGASGEVLSVDVRYSDWIESLHDGSIFGDIFKLTAMNFLGWGVMLLAITGFWLWYGPRRLRGLRWKRKRNAS